MAHLVHHFLEESADRSPFVEAVVHGTRRHTYREIEERANQIANHLIDCGVQRGDRVAILHRNSMDYLAFYFGTIKAGAIAVPLNTGLEAGDLTTDIDDCRPVVLLSENHLLRILPDPEGRLPASIRTVVVSDFSPGHTTTVIPQHRTEQIYAGSSAARPRVPLIDQDIASIVYTSGSTGKPKGATLSHLNIATNTRSIVSSLGLTSADRALVILPFYYVFGKSILMTHLMVTGSIVIDNRFAFPNTVLKTAIDESVTGIYGVPSTFSILIRRTKIKSTTFADLRYFAQAGGHLPKEIRKVFSKHFPSIEFFIMYGATEASARLAYLEPSKFSSKLEAIGKAIPNVELKVITDSCTEAKPGEQGEIAARGSNIMSGYWNAPEETGRVLRDGWYFTGDLGYRDHDGDFYVTGRKRDMIKVGPHKVSAQEIEEVVLTIAGVEESAAIGVPDPDFGEIVKVFVVADAERRTAGAESIIEHCRTLLPAYKVPKNVQFTDALPRNEAGKILKRALAERLERHDEDANSSDTDSTTDEDRAAVNAVPGRSPN